MYTFLCSSASVQARFPAHAGAAFVCMRRKVKAEVLSTPKTSSFRYLW